MTAPAKSPPSRRALRRALTALRASDPETAERLLAGFTATAPDDAEGWHYRALAAHQRDRPADAKTWFEKAAGLAPERPDFALDHARFLLERGYSAAALAMAEHVSDAGAYRERRELLVAEALVSLDRAQEAVARLQSFLEKHGAARAVWMRLFHLLDELAMDEAAVAVLEQAARHHPDDFDFAVLLATTLRGAGRDDEADRLSRRLTAQPRAPGSAWLDRAVAAAQGGDAASAVACARDAVRRAPFLGHAWLLLSELSPDPENLPLPEPRSAALQFAHARVLDRRGHYGAAWQAYELANRMAEREDGQYSPAHQDAYTSGLIEHLDADFVARTRASVSTADESEPAPVFICGVSRSGTTLLEQMLAAHPSGNIRSGGELRVIHRLLRREFGPRHLIETGKLLRSLPAPRLRSIVTAWQGVVHERAAGARFLADKMPSNVFLIGLLHAVFPRSPIVIMERLPTPLACSCFVTPFAEGHLFSHSLDTIVHYFAQFRRLVTHWEAVLPRGQLLHLRYDALLADPVQTLAPLLGRLGLAWDDSMLEFHRSRERVATASLLQVRRPLDPGADARWQRFETQLAPWRDRLEDAYDRGAARHAAGGPAPRAL